MIISVTSIYAALLGAFFLVLSFRVIYLRGGPVARLMGAGTAPVPEETLHRAVRGHANFSEYTPFFLVLMVLAEMNGGSPLWLHVAGVVFTAGRLMHGILFGFLERSVPLRIAGMVGTFVGCMLVIVMLVIG